MKKSKLDLLKAYEVYSAFGNYEEVYLPSTTSGQRDLVSIVYNHIAVKGGHESVSSAPKENVYYAAVRLVNEANEKLGNLSELEKRMLADLHKLSKLKAKDFGKYDTALESFYIGLESVNNSDYCREISDTARKVIGAPIELNENFSFNDSENKLGGEKD